MYMEEITKKQIMFFVKQIEDATKVLKREVKRGNKNAGNLSWLAYEIYRPSLLLQEEASKRYEALLEEVRQRDGVPN